MFEAEFTEEVSFPEEVRYHIANRELLEDFSDWYRGREFQPSPDWEHFCRAWKKLGLMESQPFEFSPVNELPANDSTLEILFAALSPGRVREVIDDLQKISGPSLDGFITLHELTVTTPFSQINLELGQALDPDRGLVIFAG